MPTKWPVPLDSSRRAPFPLFTTVLLGVAVPVQAVTRSCQVAGAPSKSSQKSSGALLPQRTAASPRGPSR